MYMIVYMHVYIFMYIYAYMCVFCRQISKKHQIRIDTPWLDPSKTLAEQVCTERT